MMCCADPGFPCFGLKSALQTPKRQYLRHSKSDAHHLQPQLKFGETDIAAIVIDPKSRDDIPPLLAGLQYL